MVWCSDDLLLTATSVFIIAFIAAPPVFLDLYFMEIILFLIFTLWKQYYFWCHYSYFYSYKFALLPYLGSV
ncbi:hypothetical protein Goari_010740, partial [Gossypium aridum]|nr:hypothetical protein [Gossypium aridum]